MSNKPWESDPVVSPNAKASEKMPWDSDPIATPKDLMGLPQSSVTVSQPSAPTPVGSTKVADVLQKSIFSPIDAIMPGSKMAEEPSTSVGSLAKGVKSLGDIPDQLKLASLMELISANQEKYGKNFENAPAKEQADLWNTVTSANKIISNLKSTEEDFKAIEAKYGKDPLAKKLDKLEQTPEFQSAGKWEQTGLVGKEYLKNITDFPEYAINVGLSSLPQSIAMAVAAKVGMKAGPSAAMVAGGGSSALMEYGQEYVDLREQGYTHEEANNKAMVKSAVIGMFDAASLNSAGHLAEELFEDTAKKAWKETVKDVAKEVPKQAAFGAAGEGLGSYASNQPVNPRAIFEEAIGELAGAPAEVAATYQGKKAEIENAGVPPVVPPTPKAPKPPKAATPETVAAGLVNESDLEAPAAIVPPKVAPVETPNVPHTVEQIMERGQPVDTKQEAEKAHSDGDSVYAFHEQDLAHPKLIKDIDQMEGYTADQLLVVPKEETLKPVKKPAEAIAPLDMGENTEYRVVKNDNGWTAVLVDKDSNQLVTARNFGNTEESKQKAIDYANSEHEKAKPYLEQAISEEKPSEEKPAEPAAEIPAEEKPVAETEAAAEEAAPEAEEKTQAQINQERQAAKKAKVAEEVKKSLTPEDIADAGQILKSGNGLQYTEAAKPLLKKLEQAGLINQKNGKVYIAPEATAFGIPHGDSFSPFTDSADMAKLREYLSPTPVKTAEVSPEAKAKQDLEDALADLAWLATKPTRMNMMPEDEQRLMPILTKLMDAAFRMGYHKFKAAAKFVRDMILEKFGKDVADKINLNHLQGAYIGMSANYPEASSKKEVVEVEHLDELEAEAKAEEPTGTVDLNTTEGKFHIAQAISKHFMGGLGFKDINEARRFIADLTGQKIEAGTMAAKQADEAVEVGVVLAAQNIAHKNRKPSEIYDGLVSLYNRQPNLAVRSSTSVREQAYSTPAPLAYVASQLAGITDKTTVYEPTGGNGMLLIGANPNNVTVNELNTSRYEMLKKVLPGAKVSNENAVLKSINPVDVVIANPPFGSIGEEFRVYGKTTREIDHAISYKALNDMPANGRAVLILGGVRAEGEDARREGYRQKAKREFYYNLYKDYNVVDHFSVAGDMYSKQGASYPVDVIVIDGKGQSQRALPAAELPQQITSYEELKEKLNEPSVVSRENVSPTRTNVSERTAGEPKPEPVGERPSGQGREAGAEGERPTEGGRRGVSENGVGKRGQPEPAGAGVSAGQPGLANEPERGINRRPVPSEGGEQQPSGRKGVAGNEPSPVGGPSVVSGTRVESGLKDRRGQETETGHQVAYQPHSQAASVGTLVPKAMAESIDNSITEVEREVGDVDEYVAEALHMDPETLREKFSAEQIDALVLAIRNAEAGKGFIIGDQTGIGKGRVVAAMIKYAIENDKVPIFVTEKPNLYSDMIRDLDDIGMTKELGLDTAKPRILITNGSESIPYTLLRKVGSEVTENNLTLKSPKSGKALDDLMKDMRAKESLGDYKVIFTTYSQLQSVKQKETERQRFIKEFGLGNYMIFDESHNAGGAGETQARSKEQRESQKEGKSLATGRAAFVRDLVDNAFGTFFSSATYAKRPDVMDLYSSTDMKLAVDNINELADAIKLGGIPMQQIVANMLTKVGQYIRRERTFAGVSYQTQETKVDKQTAENMATSMRDILAFSRSKEAVVKEMQKEFDKFGGRASIEGEKTQIQSANFGAIMHNLIDQMLLSLKAQDSIKHAVESLKNGEKVVMTVSNTMGSFLQSYADEMGINVGDPVNLTFKDLYLRYLEKQRMLKIKGPNGVQQYRMTDQDLGPERLAAYNQIKTFIENAGFGSAPISPIDYMHNEFRKAGYKTEEITGRTVTLNYESGTPILTSRSANIKQRVGAVRAFNNGTADVIILNQAGSTGLSLHASSSFKDQRKRHMIIVQPEKNIDTHMQMLGRVHRTGQVVAPAYSQMMADIPAEMRPAAVLLKKMASLNANTTASRKSAVTAEGAVDFMNDYGGQIAQEYLRDNPEVHEAIGGKKVVDLIEDPTDAKEDDIRRLTGYIPILPIKEQEEIYKDLIDRYNDLVERENSMGTNKLEAKAVDLDAETLSAVPITPDKGDPSLFAQPAYMEKVDVKRTVKPYTKQEVQEMVSENLEGGTQRQKVDKLMDGVRERAAEYAQKQLANLTEKGADQVKIDATKGQFNLQYQHVKSVLENYAVGQPISIKNNQGIFVYGVVTDLENKKKTANPVAGSDWKMHIALANGDAKAITINFSQIGSTYQLNQENYINWYNPDTQQTVNIPLTDLFDKGSNVRREKRWMVTGNILSGFASDAVKNQGQIMSYTKADGTTGQGILMPRTYDFEKAAREAPIRLRSAADAMRFMNEVNGVITSADNVLRITKSSYGNQYQFNVPSSKKEGGTYFLDRGLTDITGDFYKSGNTMYARGNEQQAAKAIDFILNERGDTLIASSPRDKAREMFAPPKATVTPSVIPKGMKEQIAQIHKEKTEELSRVRRGMTKIKREVIKGETTINTQRELTYLDQLAKELAADKKMTAEKKITPEAFMARALNEYNKGNISKDVLDVIQYIYRQSPAILTGLRLSVKQAPQNAAYTAAGLFDSLERIVRLYKESGAVNPGTIRHELMHSLEQMMDPQTQQAIVESWRAALEKAIKKNTDEVSQKYFMAVIDYVNDPSEKNFEKAMELLPSQDMYQYINPSEFWAVNAEKLFGTRMGTPWGRYVNAIRQVFEAMKKLFGFNNTHSVYKAFNDLIKGETPRTHKTMLVDLISSGPYKTKFLYSVEKTDELLAKHNRNDAPIHTSNGVMDKFLGGAQEAKNIGAKMVESPRLAVNNMVGNLDRAVLATRIKTTDFTAGLTAADAARYGRMLEDSEGRAVASVAMNQALKATRIGTQVIMLGKLVFDNTNQMFHAVQDKFSMANILTLKHQLEKEIGVQRAANVIQAYFEAKRSRSIVDEYLKREGELEMLKTEQMDPRTSPDRQLLLLDKIADAEQDFKNIGIALQKVNMSDEAIDDFSKLDKQYPELRKMMNNWNAVNKNMIDMMEQSRMISKQRADTLRDIEDYVPWQRIMDDQTDVHTPIYSSKGVKNIAREHRFKEGKVDLDIDDIVDNMLHNVMVTTRNAIKNYAANRIAQEYGTRNENGKLKVFPKEDPARGIVKILISGRKVNIQIADPLIAQSVIGIENIQIPMNEIMAYFANGLRRSITFSGVFQLKQLFMDAPTAAIVTGVKNPVALFGGVFGSFVKGLTQKDEVVELLKSYGIGGYHSGARTAEHQYKQEIGLLNKSAFARVTSILDQIADASDFAQRRAVYVRVMKETGGFPSGGDQRKAILAATNVIDFDKRGMGRTAQFLNRTISFMNAYAQQIDVLTQALAEPIAGGVENLTGQKVTSISGGLRGLDRQQAMTRLAIASGLLASTCLLYAFAIGDDDEYKKMDDQTKMRNFVIPRSMMKTIGYDHTLLIPMHTSASYFFKSIPEMLYNKITKEGTKDAIDNARLRKALKEGAVDALLGPLGSGPVPTAIKPFAEIALNHDFYTGGNVTPESMKDLAAFRQYNGSTSELGKWISYASGLGSQEHRMLSPIQADHVMRGLGGSVAAAAMWGSNLFSGHKASPEERNNPLYGSFIAPELPRGREDLFYDLKTRSDTAMGTFKDLIKKGHKDEAQQWFKDHEGEIKASGFTASAGKALIDINAEIRRIEDLPANRLSPEEKRQQINFYKKKKEEILDQTIKFRLSAGL